MTRIRSRRRVDETGVEIGESVVDGQVVAEVLAGMHSKSGKGTEEASNTGMEEGGPAAGNEGHCRIGAVVAETEGVCVTGVGALEMGEDASVELEGDRGTLSTG